MGMKKKLFLLQIVALAVTVLGIAGLGILVFLRGAMNMTAIYLFAGLGITGFVGNAVLALLRVLVEKDSHL